jgi:hypothetical protein
MSAVIPLWMTAELKNPFHVECNTCYTLEDLDEFRGRFERRSDYCSAVRTMTPFDNDVVMLNLVETHIFDFFTGRKEYAIRLNNRL